MSHPPTPCPSRPSRSRWRPSAARARSSPSPTTPKSRCRSRSQIQSLTLDENGGRKLAKAKDNFLVFPPQALIPPGASQVVSPAVGRRSHHSAIRKLHAVGQPDSREAACRQERRADRHELRRRRQRRATAGLADASRSSAPARRPTRPASASRRSPSRTSQASMRCFRSRRSNCPPAAGTRQMAASEISEKVGIGLVPAGARSANSRCRSSCLPTSRTCRRRSISNRSGNACRVGSAAERSNESEVVQARV